MILSRIRMVCHIITAIQNEMHHQFNDWKSPRKCVADWGSGAETSVEVLVFREKCLETWDRQCLTSRCLALDDVISTSHHDLLIFQILFKILSGWLHLNLFSLIDRGFRWFVIRTWAKNAPLSYPVHLSAMRAKHPMSWMILHEIVALVALTAPKIRKES